MGGRNGRNMGGEMGEPWAGKWAKKKELWRMHVNTV